MTIRTIRDVADALRTQADAERWGSQEAVATWLRILASRLDEISLSVLDDAAQIAADYRGLLAAFERTSIDLARLRLQVAPDITVEAAS